MPQEWEAGNAARQPAYDESNPFAPIDYNTRLQNSSRRRRSTPVSRARKNCRTSRKPPPGSPSAFLPPSLLHQGADGDSARTTPRASDTKGGQPDRLSPLFFASVSSRISGIVLRLRIHGADSPDTGAIPPDGVKNQD